MGALQRTLFALFFVGHVVLRVVFGIAGGVIGLLLGLAWFAVKAMLVAGSSRNVRGC